MCIRDRKSLLSATYTFCVGYVSLTFSDSSTFNNNKLIENIEIGFKDKRGDIIGIKTIKHIK